MKLHLDLEIKKESCRETDCLPRWHKCMFCFVSRLPSFDQNARWMRTRSTSLIHEDCVIFVETSCYQLNPVLEQGQPRTIDWIGLNWACMLTLPFGSINMIVGKSHISFPRLNLGRQTQVGNLDTLHKTGKNYFAICSKTTIVTRPALSLTKYTLIIWW